MRYTFEQQIDRKALEYIIENADQYDLGKAYIDGVETSDFQSVLSLLKNFLNSLDDTGKVSVKYTTKGLSERKFGKNIGITNLSRKIRHTIARNYNLDIDIKNCHPLFVQKYCSDNEIPCPMLDSYISDRDSILSQAERVGVSKDDLKKQFLSLINGGSVRIQDRFIYDFAGECKTIHGEINKHEKGLIEKVCKSGKKYNIQGSAINLLLCDMENRALEVMIKYFKKKQVKVTSLAFDGLTIERTPLTEANMDKYLSECSKLLSKEMDIPHMIVAEKKMNEGWDLSDKLDGFKGRCICNTDHSDMFKIVGFLTKTLKISSTGGDFDRCVQFIMNYTDPKCTLKFIYKLGKDIEDMDEVKLPDANLEMSWSWLEQFVPPKKADFKWLRDIIADKKASALFDLSDVSEVSSKPFQANDRIYDFIVRYTGTVFPSWEDCVTDFLENVDRYCKKILFPPTFVINHGNGDIEQVKSVKCQTRFVEGAGKGVSTESRHVFDGPHSSGMIEDIDIYCKLPLYRKITFNPRVNDVPPDEYNMYSGFKAKSVDSVDMKLIAPILNHIKLCWADNNDDLYDYIMQWFRQAFSEPWNKTGVVLLLYGLEGTGKGLLIDNLIIPLIYGSKISCISQGLEPIVQRFNGICADKCFMGVNEVSTEGSWACSWEKLKALITDPTITIEKKGIDIFKDYPNHINFIFTTNNHDSVKLGKTDRRYCCLETSARFKGNYEYFSELLASCSQEAADHFYTYVCNIPRTRNIKNIPMTALKKDMMLLSIDSIEKFRLELMETVKNWQESGEKDHNELWNYNIYSNLKNEEVPAMQLYEAYKEWCKARNEKVKTSTVFGRDIKKHLEYCRTNKGYVYKIRG